MSKFDGKWGCYWCGKVFDAPHYCDGVESLGELDRKLRTHLHIGLVYESAEQRATAAESDANASRLKREALERELAESRRLSCERHERVKVLELALAESRHDAERERGYAREAERLMLGREEQLNAEREARRGERQKP